MDLLTFYADNQLIKKATANDETPTPGYLFHEIVGMYNYYNYYNNSKI